MNLHPRKRLLRGKRRQRRLQPKQRLPQRKLLPKEEGKRSRYETACSIILLQKFTNTCESQSESDEVIELDDSEEEEEEPPKPTKRTNRAAVLRYVFAFNLFTRESSTFQYFLINSQPKTKKAPAKKAAPAAKQSQLTFAPAGRSSRAAATKAKGKMVVSFLMKCVLSIWFSWTYIG